MWRDIGEKGSPPRGRAVCPFSRNPCRSCSQYRGRHYDLCGQRSQEGILGGLWGPRRGPSFVGVELIAIDPVDMIPPNPTWLVLDDIFERSEE